MSFSSRTPHASVSRRARSSQRGFTLIEVIIAVTIVALMAAIFVPRLTRFIGSAKDKRAQTEAAALANQVRLYMTEAGMSRCPEDFDLEVLTEGDDPLLGSKSDLLDPWGNAYVLVVPGVANFDFDVMSYGADGQPGGELENKDIVNGRK